MPISSKGIQKIFGDEGQLQTPGSYVGYNSGRQNVRLATGNASLTRDAQSPVSTNFWDDVFLLEDVEFDPSVEDDALQVILVRLTGKLSFEESGNFFVDYLWEEVREDEDGIPQTLTDGLTSETEGFARNLYELSHYNLPHNGIYIDPTTELQPLVRLVQYRTGEDQSVWRFNVHYSGVWFGKVTSRSGAVNATYDVEAFSNPNIAMTGATPRSRIFEDIDLEWQAADVYSEVTGSNENAICKIGQEPDGTLYLLWVPETLILTDCDDALAVRSTEEEASFSSRAISTSVAYAQSATNMLGGGAL